jgi:hypothetical protein
LSRDLKAQHKEVRWKDIAGIGNILRREQPSSQHLHLRNLRRNDGMYFVIHANSLAGLPLT